MGLFTPELSLGVLVWLFIARELAMRHRGERSLTSFRRIGKPFPKNAAPFLHPQTQRIVEHVIDTMREKDIDALIPVILQKTVISRRLRRALTYLEIDPGAFAKDLSTLQGLMDTTYEAEKFFSPRGELFQRLLREALVESLNLGHAYIMPEDLVLAVLDEEIPVLKNFLARWNVTQDDLRSIAYVLDSGRRHFFRKSSRTIKHRIMNRAWTARPTYILDRYSTDLTDLAREGYAGFLVGHQNEVNAMLRILNRATKNNIMLVGESGTGKTTIMEHISWLITREEVPEKLFDKRLAVLDIGLLVAGSKNVGDLQNRVV